MNLFDPFCLTSNKSLVGQQHILDHRAYSLSTKPIFILFSSCQILCTLVDVDAPVTLSRYYFPFLLIFQVSFLYHSSSAVYNPLAETLGFMIFMAMEQLAFAKRDRGCGIFTR
jgi:hypothetical protein